MDVIQGGAGTSSNMNANEVIANRALEILGHPKGDYARLHPNDHVNLSQSTNDVYPTAVKLGTIFAARELLDALAELEEAFAAKATGIPHRGQNGPHPAPGRRAHDPRPGIRHLRRDHRRGPAPPGRSGPADPRNQPRRHRHRHRPERPAPATPRQPAGTWPRSPACPWSPPSDLIEATQDVGAFVHLSGVLKRVAVKLSKICNDLRLLSSGPRAGFGEINLPAVQSGSSIMPGKINPVIPEVVSQVAYEVIGNDVTITMAAEAGQLQLNAFEPIIVHSLHKSISHLEAACRTLTARCIRGITANTEHLRLTVEQSIGLVTALNPHLGYATATAIAQEALATGKGVAELVLEHGLLTADQLQELLSPERLANLSK